MGATEKWVWLKTASGEVAFNPAVGNLHGFKLFYDNKNLLPLHTAPWVEEAIYDASVLDKTTVPPVDCDLSGDFFCAPFGLGDIEEAPPHGWSANSRWMVEETSDCHVRAVLERRILGATLEKCIGLSHDAPLLYQTHRITGGHTGLTVSHHPMVHVTGGARFFCSPKRLALTIDVPIVEERHAFACGQASSDLGGIPAANGGMLDVTELPVAEGTEDFVTLVEQEGSPLGWSAVIREAFDDIVFVLKDPSVLPITMLWHSNGGRVDHPWNGRHHHVLGIEDACAAGAAGHSASLGNNALSRLGVRTALPLPVPEGHTVHHVIGAITRPAGWDRIESIQVDGGTLRIFGPENAVIALPFKDGFFKRR